MHRLLTTHIVSLIIIAIYIPLACLDYHHLPYSDGAEHGAAVRELARDLLNPGEPMLNEYVGKSPRYVPSIVLMAAAVRLTGMHVLNAIKIFSVLFFVFLLYCASFFIREYFQEPRQAAWPIACMLFLWGTGWHGANAYMFSALVHTAWYPSLVSFACMFMALAFACRFLRGTRKTSFACWCLFGALAFVNHPPTGLFFWMASALLVAEIRGVRTLLQPWYAVSIAAAVGAIAVWPYYNFFENALQVTGGTMGATWDYTLTRNYLYSDIVLRIGPALVALPIVCIYLLKRKYSCLTLLCIGTAGIYAAGYFLRISLAERFIFAAMFSAQLLFAACAAELRQSVRLKNASAVQAGCAAIMAVLIAAGMTGQALIIFNEYIRPAFSLSNQAPLVSFHDPTALHKKFADYIHPGDVVLSDVPSSWGVPLYTGAKIVSLFHTPTHVNDNDMRIKDVNLFYDPATNNTQRMNMLRKYGVTKILLHFTVNGSQIFNQVQEMGFPRIAYNDIFCIFDTAIALTADTPAGAAPAANPPASAQPQ